MSFRTGENPDASRQSWWERFPSAFGRHKFSLAGVTDFNFRSVEDVIHTVPPCAPHFRNGFRRGL